MNQFSVAASRDKLGNEFFDYPLRNLGAAKLDGRRSPWAAIYAAIHLKNFPSGDAHYASRHESFHQGQ